MRILAMIPLALTLEAYELTCKRLDLEFWKQSDKAFPENSNKVNCEALKKSIYLLDERIKNGCRLDCWDEDYKEIAPLVLKKECK